MRHQQPTTPQDSALCPRQRSQLRNRSLYMVARAVVLEARDAHDLNWAEVLLEGSADKSIIISLFWVYDHPSHSPAGS
jgi:hypothetical protein